MVSFDENLASELYLLYDNLASTTSRINQEKKVTSSLSLIDLDTRGELQTKQLFYSWQ